MRIFNTQTRTKEEFIPIEPNKAKIYVCGPTVYNYIHIGNARPLVIFDTLRRFLTYKGYEVTFVQNVTDVDDKIIKRAAQENVSPDEISKKYTAEYIKDFKGLNVNEPTFMPKVTENMEEIISMIKTLIEKGHAYVVEGDVYFDTESFKNYGKLSGQSIDDREAGARIGVDERKKNYMDFALWKSQKEGEIAWDSPWGKGRPGWHIECSVMSKKYLGETIDIHCGGQDLIFPHHENEKAQSECANEKQFVKYWMHNGFINVNNEKMSKSLNNFSTTREAAEKYGYDVIRFFMLSVHYRNPINFSPEIMEQGKNSLERIYNFYQNMKFFMDNSSGNIEEPMSEEENKLVAKIDALKEKFIEVMEDDLNTADAVTAIFEIIREANISINADSSKAAIKYAMDSVKTLCDILGIKCEKESTGENEDEIKELVRQRQEARKNKNWAEADRIRDALKAMGITLEDTPQGVKVVRK